jgi:integrase
MPRSIPSYRFHKASGRAVIQWRPLFGNSPHYLAGAYNSPESKAEYAQILKRITSPPVPSKSVKKSKIVTVRRLALLYLAHVKEYHGKATEAKKIGTALAVLVAKYPKMPVKKFGPKALKRVRKAMLPKGWARSYINEQVGRIRRMFKWGITEEIVRRKDFAALTLVDGLRRGRTTAREKKKVSPIEWEYVARVLPFVSPTIATMVQVQYLTGMRSDELTALAADEIDRTQDPWLYNPTKHKTEWKDLEKFVYFGPKAQALLAPYFKDAAPFLFTPARAWQETIERRRADRKTPIYPSSVKPSKPRKLSKRYTARSYQQAINHGFVRLARSLGHSEPIVETIEVEGKKKRKLKVNPRVWLKAAGITYWHPHQLRHTRATETRSRYGLEGAMAQIGNTFDATVIYAEKSATLAARIACETG